MIILPEKGLWRSKVLLPISLSDWREPSRAQEKNLFGHQNQTRFNATARLNGRIVWRGWFDDRDEFDVFAWSFATGQLAKDRFAQRLPSPEWNPDLAEVEGLEYEFITTYFFISSTTWTVPSDCVGISGLSGEFIDCIGGGGSGAAWNGFVSDRVTSGSGAACSRITSLSLVGIPSVTVQVGAAGAAVASADNNGNNGTGTWFNGTALNSASCSADFGLGGIGNNSANVTGPSGGQAANGIGTVKFSGGKAGNASHARTAAGAGGSAGPSGDGVAGTNTSAGSQQTAGGAGDNSLGGAGGAPGAAGVDGQEYDSTHGSGGGAGSTFLSSGTATGKAAGNYGAGSGCSLGTTGGSTLAAAPGLSVVAYTPYTPSGSFYVPNSPMLGM